jgi:hypothetical protein
MPANAFSDRSRNREISLLLSFLSDALGWLAAKIAGDDWSG